MYGLKSSGIHSNGYSLIRKILETHEYPNMYELIEPNIIYVDIIYFFKPIFKKPFNVLPSCLSIA